MVFICTASLTFTNSTFYPHTVFMCLVWIWEQTAIISLYRIKWVVFITETECLLHGKGWVFNYNSGLPTPLKCSSPSQHSVNSTNRTTAALALSSTPWHFHFLPRMTKYPLQHPHLVTNKFRIPILQIRKQNLNFEVWGITALVMNSTVFWNLTPCRWENTFRRFEGS